MGSHLTAELLREGCSVRLIVRNAGKTDLLKATLRRMGMADRYDRIEFRRLVGAPVRPKNGLENAESAFPPDLLCPASSAVRLNRPLACFSYGMTRDNLSRDGYRRYAFRLPRILKPSGSAAWFDTLGAYAQNNPDCFPESEEGNPNGRLVYRHRRMVNVGFFDGHVAPMSPAAVACRWGSREARFNRYFCGDD